MLFVCNICNENNDILGEPSRHLPRSTATIPELEILFEVKMSYKFKLVVRVSNKSYTAMTYKRKFDIAVNVYDLRYNFLI